MTKKLEALNKPLTLRNPADIQKNESSAQTEPGKRLLSAFAIMPHLLQIFLAVLSRRKIYAEFLSRMKFMRVQALIKSLRFCMTRLKNSKKTLTFFTKRRSHCSKAFSMILKKQLVNLFLVLK